MIYLTDKHIDYAPEDATEIVYLNNTIAQHFDGIKTYEFEYWTTTPGEDVQMWATGNIYNKGINEDDGLKWYLITDTPEKYTTLVSPLRFCNITPTTNSIEGEIVW